MELERQKNRAKDENNLMSSENEDLQMRIDALKSDLVSHAFRQREVEYYCAN